MPRRKLGPGTLEALGHYANTAGLSLARAAAGVGGDIPDAGRERLRQFVSWMDTTRQRCFSGDAIAVRVTTVSP